MKEIINIEDFNEFINNENTIVIFYTKWCPICKMLIFTIEEYIEEHSEIRCAKICLSECLDIVNDLHITSAPTTLFYNNGNLIEKRHGMLEIEDIEEIFYH